MNTACIVKAHEAGLFSIVNNFVIWAHIYTRLYADWRESLYSADGANLWDDLFLPLFQPEEPHDVVGVHSNQWLTWKNAGLLYQGKNPEHADWRQRCHMIWNQWFRPRAGVTDFVDEFVRDHFSTHRTVAALIRWHGHAGEQITTRSQTLEEYAHAIEAQRPSRVYIASSDEQSLAWFKERFPVSCHPHTVRSATRDVDRHRVVKQTPEDAIHALQEVLLLSHADALVHPISNLATAALYIRPELESVFLL